MKEILEELEAHIGTEDAGLIEAKVNREEHVSGRVAVQDLVFLFLYNKHEYALILTFLTKNYQLIMQIRHIYNTNMHLIYV